MYILCCYAEEGEKVTNKYRNMSCTVLLLLFLGTADCGEHRMLSHHIFFKYFDDGEDCADIVFGVIGS